MIHIILLSLGQERREDCHSILAEMPAGGPGSGADWGVFGLAKHATAWIPGPSQFGIRASSDTLGLVCLGLISVFRVT